MFTLYVCSNEYDLPFGETTPMHAPSETTPMNAPDERTPMHTPSAGTPYLALANDTPQKSPVTMRSGGDIKRPAKYKR